MIFTVYSREACHLCQEMIQALQCLQKDKAFEFEIVDIDTKPELVERYGTKVPVLVSQEDNTEICHYHLNMSAFDAYFADFLLGDGHN